MWAVLSVDVSQLVTAVEQYTKANSSALHQPNQIIAKICRTTYFTLRRVHCRS